MEVNKIYNENCLQTLKRFDDSSIDIVITSPPYNMNLRIRNGSYCSRQIVKEFSTKYEGFDDNLPIDEFYELHSNIIRELLRVSNVIFYNIQIVTGSKRAFFKIIGEFSEQLKDIVIWDKGVGQPAMSPGSNGFQPSSALLATNCHSQLQIVRQYSAVWFGHVLHPPVRATFPKSL
jgi:site-specific DNA-methyltransferase (adenine-specific)/modification methylase